MRTRRIMKFGGSSLADADCFRRAADIITKSIELNPVIVVSAPGCTKECRVKVTDSLWEAGKTLLEGKNADDTINAVLKRYDSLVSDLGLSPEILKTNKQKLSEVKDKIVGSTYASREEALDAIMAFGEILSADIMAEYLVSLGLSFRTADPAVFSFITSDRFQNADILEESLEKIATRIIAASDHLVFPGFVGVTADGRRTTLGRGGSDYTAAVLGAALKRDVEIWTDVNGIYRIDPKYLPEEFRKIGHPETIPQLSYDEAFQMAAFGSRVLYKKTLDAIEHAMRKGKHIRIYIKNTFNPEYPGTVVSSVREQSGAPRGITCLEETQLFNIYPESHKEAREFTENLEKIPNVTTVLASETWGRLSCVLDEFHPNLSELETRFPGHLSRDQVLIKIVGDGIGDNPRILSRIHSALQSAENPEKYGMTLVHKSPRILTENTFEIIVKKRGLTDVLSKLYKDLFMEEIVTVGLLGMGTVGTGVLRYSREMYSEEKSGFKLDFPITLVRNPEKVREIEFNGKISTKPEEILDNPLIDIVLEVMGGIEPARTYILEALKKGKDVVTANKALLAEHGAEIFRIADHRRRNIGFEASVCAEIPIIEDFLSFPGLADIRGIEGIVNGTSNYVLTRFMEGMSFEDALKLAQQKGFAEADPFMDISGTDAAQKLSILASILFNQPVSYHRIPRQGIEGLTPVDSKTFETWDFTVKPLVLAKREEEKIHLRVAPALIPLNHPLASVREENNALSLYLSGREEPITKIGKGAGAIPTARSIVRDILDVSRKSRAYMVDVPGYYRSKNPTAISEDGDFESAWYIRFFVDDTPGVFGKIASILGDFNLSIWRVLQEKQEMQDGAHIQFELKKSTRTNLDRAVDVITRFPFVRGHFSCMIIGP